MGSEVKTVAVCDTQPISIEGIRSLLAPCPDLDFVAGAVSLVGCMELVREKEPSLALIDKAFGLNAVIDWVSNVRAFSAPIVWGSGITELEAVRMVQAGAMGVAHKTTSLESLLACFRAVAEGRTWMDESLLREHDRSRAWHGPHLTPREMQVLDLVEQGLKNKEIGGKLGIRAGTVKIHLKHIFEKSGVRGRYGLALSGLKKKGLTSVQSA